MRAKAATAAAPNPSISVVIPALDEGLTIADVVTRCQHFATSVTVVDGRSTDSTAAIARKHGASVLDGGRGKGTALRRALREVEGDVLVFFDADGSHDPADIPRLAQPILDGKADLVIGSRVRGGSDDTQGDLHEVVRMIGSAVITMGINWRFGTRLTDSQNGLRAIRADVARTLDLREETTTIEQEMLIKALRAGLRVLELPTHERPRRFGQSRFRLREVWPRYVYSWVRYTWLDPRSPTRRP